MMMKRTYRPITRLVVTALFFASVGCKKDNGNSTTPNYTVPDTYNFSDADSLTAKTYLSMLGEMEIAINLGNTSGNVLSSAKLKGMFANTGNYFTDTVFNGVTLNLNSSGLSLKNGTITAAQAAIDILLDSVVDASETGLPASNGVAGVSTRKTLLSAHGVYWRQFFTKTIMGVFIAHQITDVYLGDSLNSNISTAAKIHAWDQAFYLWCVPANFPDNRKNVKYWGSYTSQVDSGVARPVTALTGINANKTLTDAFLKGRAALANNDIATALQQAAIIIPVFETLEAAAAVHEMNESRNNLANGPAAVVGTLSEGLGFWTGLKFNNHKKINDADYQAVLALFGDNFYNMTPAGIDAIIDKISSIYGWDAIKSNL
jgi:hypothetical protein